MLPLNLLSPSSKVAAKRSEPGILKVTTEELRHLLDEKLQPNDPNRGY